uniref:Large ribosomal subunit protein uL23c n=1 Tax=Chlamydomonas chlamydogama TaxID=225041 RepID=A0A7S2VVV2_9CHLO|mmetsp:Transcript_709/g.1624  ORF Transcript_709/g.1624 Transcript_709/m.1624 type:complete len:235 (+) Transcript_709:36-740(+)
MFRAAEHLLIKDACKASAWLDFNEHLRTASQLVIETASCSSSCLTSPKSYQSRTYKGYAYEDQRQANDPVKFASAESTIMPRAPFRRAPIYFPDVRLQMLKPSPEVLKQIKETGWAREVAFRTTPNMTKLEIKGILESLYGMKVERVSTINYLGRRHVTVDQLKRTQWREDDWKKAYVIFKRPADVQLQSSKPAQRPSMLEQLMRAKGVEPRTQAPAGVAALAPAAGLQRSGQQ